jgi:hypothetical protein
MSHLIPCLSCHRHVRVDEDACPFCGVERSLELRASAPPALPKRRLGRAALFAFGATLAGANCGDVTPTSDAGADGATKDGAAGASGVAGTGAGGNSGAAGGVVALYGGPPGTAGKGAAGAGGTSGGTAGAGPAPAYGAAPLYGLPGPTNGDT